MAQYDVVAKRGKAFLVVGRLRLNVNGYGKLELRVPATGLLSLQPAREPDDEPTVSNRPRMRLPSIR